MVHVKIIGTSHIASESIDKVKRFIEEKKPDIVAIELDKKRLYALLNKTAKGPGWRDICRIGIKGWLFAIMGSWASKKLGSRVGVSPGSEMLGAVDSARIIGAKIALIDQDIEVTLKKFSKVLTWKEKWRFMVDIVKGVFFRKGISFDLSKVPPKEVIQSLLAEVKNRYPNVYKVLVDDRNHFMARRIAQLAYDSSESLIVAVVGAGHEEEMVVLAKKYLNELRQKEIE